LFILYSVILYLSIGFFIFSGEFVTR